MVHGMIQILIHIADVICESGMCSKKYKMLEIGIIAYRHKYPVISGLVFYLFSVLCHALYLCIGYTVTDYWKGGESQYIQLFKVVYCKLQTNSKQLPAF